MPGGPRGLQNRRLLVQQVEECSIRSLSALLICDLRFAIYEPYLVAAVTHPTNHKSQITNRKSQIANRKSQIADLKSQIVNPLSREQILKLTSLSSCAG